LRFVQSSLFLIAAGYGAEARAQADINPTMPNALLLVDTSGSMEYKTASNTFPICRYDANGLIPSPPATSEKSRWVDMIEVLTGSITNYDCQTLDRGTTAFRTEYAIPGSPLGATSPYDFLYANAYHRPLSGGCAIGPGTISVTNPAAFPANSFNYHTYNSVGTSCTFNQTPDGILDAFLSDTRFGLMTFDTDPSPLQNEVGTYSYVVGASHVGKPAGCDTASAMEVGARNASAPPWEGRLVAFGDPNPGSTDFQNKNAQIQQVLRATRPYGATPIAGMLTDARDFLWNDATKDLVNTSQDFGPMNDPYTKCRKTRIVLMSDGQPNMDLRGHCNGNDCPFPLPETVSADLATKDVRTFVVGFALNTLTVAGSPVDCTLLKASDLDTTTGSLCASNPADLSLQACCTLARIAIAGDPGNGSAHAYFANNRETLRAALSSILSDPGNKTSRTQPGFAAVSNTSANPDAASLRFASGFTPATVQLWPGRLDRTRWKCDPTTHIAAPANPSPDPSKGDVFATNLISPTGRARTFYTVQAANTGGVFSDRSIRPNVTTDPDGAGSYSGTFTSGQTASTFVSNTSPASMGITDTTCTDGLNAAACRDRYLNWLVGIPNGTLDSRCDSVRCSLLGDIFHSTPKIVDAPSSFTLDQTYQLFQRTYATRPMMVYTSSNDGFLHAFKTATNLAGDSETTTKGPDNNELWAFVPPQVLPHIPAEYPYTHQVLLDGMPVVKDVIAKQTSTAYPYIFERSAADALAGASASVTWRTILVQSFGGLYPGYFALDVTNPDPLMTINGEKGGPRFLWQLTSDAAGNPLFGSGGATPVITTLLVDEDGTGAREVAVALLPGGPGGAGNAGLAATPGCLRATSSSDIAKFTDYPPRSRVPCYTTNLGARSLTVVRLDNGKIIRSFRRSKTEVPSALQARVIESPLDSPITGEPVAYPADTGAVADRAYVGDQDGALWKVDLSNSSPDLWTMSLYWDAFPNVSIHTKPPAGWNDGQPIATAPVLSVDTSGNLTVALSTGDQNAIGLSPTMLNYVWSLNELLDTTSSTYRPKLLWLEQFLNGERVTGPMALFASNLYFTSVAPPAAGDVCASSSGAKVWGVHYMLTPDDVAKKSSPDRTVGGAPADGIVAANKAASQSLTQQYLTDTVLLGNAGTDNSKSAVFFGAAITQVPTCFDTTTVDDAYLGKRTQISNVNPGKFQISFGIGAAKVGSNAPVSSVGDGTVSLDLPTPAMPSRINAWASIVE